MEKFELHNKFYDTLEDILIPVDFTRKCKKGSFANVPMVFDIEASSFYEDDEKRSCMYAWVFGINGKCIRGRTWNEFLEVINNLIEYYKLDTSRRAIIYVHNLAYEFQWFQHYFEWDKVFALDQRKPIYAITKDGIEFRCSYILSGYSLANVGNNLLKYKVKKMVGDLNYDLLRTSSTPLTDTEWGYILNDGLVVMAYIQEEIERLGNIKKIPLTKTGYVRELCRVNCLTDVNPRRWDYKNLISGLTMTTNQYDLMKEVFSGGFTHANHNWVNKECKNVSSFDFTSSYPAVMLSEKFPMSKPSHHNVKSSSEFYYLIDNKCCLMVLRFTGIEAKVDYEHYISVSKCLEIENFVPDNGRVVEAETLTIAITEQDFLIIEEMYKWDKLEVLTLYSFEKDYLPKPFLETILKLYSDKTTLKGVEGREVDYMVAKGMLNSCYGMCVTDPCKDENVYDTSWTTVKGNIDDLITKYNDNPERFLYYAWGLWVVVYAKRNLFTGIREFKNDYIYADTDSLKVFNVDKHTDYINKYNKNITKKVVECLKARGISPKLAVPKTIKGVEKPIGVWDFEGTYTRFKTLGAKRYLYEDNGDLHITISGVSKKAGLEYLKYKYNTNDVIFKHFTEDLVFPAHYNYNGVDKNASGKLCHTYIDIPMEGWVKDYLGNYNYYKELSGVHLEATSYELSLDFQFKQYLMGYKEV